jgi:hypothetical protein
MRRRSIARAATAAGSVAAIVLGGVLLGSPAAADVNCRSGYHCVMKDSLNDNQRFDYFNTDTNFTNDYFSNGGGVVNDNVTAASNYTTGAYESHFYVDINHGTLLFCVNPRSETGTYLPAAQNDRASSLLLRGTTSISCF